MLPWFFPLPYVSCKVTESIRDPQDINNKHWNKSQRKLGDDASSRYIICYTLQFSFIYIDNNFPGKNTDQE